MSSSDRELDRYYSPEWTVRLLLESIDGDDWGPTVAEPCAGRGDIVDVLESEGFDTVAGDLDPDSEFERVDAVDPVARLRYRDADSVITNPPYTADSGSAFDVLENLIPLGVPVAMLLRLSFLEPPKRAGRRVCFQDPDSDLYPHRAIILTRVHYEGPEGGDSNPETSVWVVWRPDLDDGGPAKLEFRGPRAEQRARGQLSCL